MLFNIRKNNSKNLWSKFGVNASESDKNILISSIFAEADSKDIFLESANEWFANQVYQNFSLTIEFINTLKTIDASLYGYYTLKNGIVDEIVLATKDYEKSNFDNITSIVTKYENRTKKQTYYYYVKKIKEIPSGVIELKVGEQYCL